MTIVQDHEQNFSQLSRAFDHNDVCLVACKLRETGEDVAAICAVNRGEDESITLLPFAIMVNGNPFELLISPIEVDELEAASK